MPTLLNYDQWLADSSLSRTWAGDKHRPASIGNIIQDNPASIVIQRDGVSNLAAQQVRIATYSGVQEVEYLFATGLLRTEGFVLLGYKNHPTVTDTDVQTGDRFTHDSRVFEVEKVIADLDFCLLAYLEEQE